MNRGLNANGLLFFFFDYLEEELLNSIEIFLRAGTSCSSSCDAMPTPRPFTASYLVREGLTANDTVVCIRRLVRNTAVVEFVVYHI